MALAMLAFVEALVAEFNKELEIALFCWMFQFPLTREGKNANNGFFQYSERVSTGIFHFRAIYERYEKWIFFEENFNRFKVRIQIPKVKLQEFRFLILIAVFYFYKTISDINVGFILSRVYPPYHYFHQNPFSTRIMTSDPSGLSDELIDHKSVWALGTTLI